MQDTGTPNEIVLLWKVAAWAVAAVIIDQFSKFFVRRFLKFGEPHTVIDGWLYFTRAKNFGAAWSVLSGQRIALVLITLVVIGLLFGAAKELASNGLAARIGLGLVLGGAFGNLIDRLLFGHVTDFIDMGSPWHWLATFPVFNIADSCLTVGAVLLAVSFLLVKNTS
ncbi:MAG: signal peptidase II [Abditibacteriaceae bacterium]